MGKNKRGQTKILIMALIITVSIVGILIVFNVVRPLVSEKEGEIETGFKGYLASLQDRDGDGYTNEQEYAAGTDPEDPDDFPIAPIIEEYILPTIFEEDILLCQNLTNPNTIYYLTANLSGVEVIPQCINISANNITFDCQGNSIKNPNLLTYIVKASGDYITIKNCNLEPGIRQHNQGRGIGISLNGNNGRIEDNNITNSFFGIRTHGNNNTIINNYVERSEKSVQVGGNNNLIKNNVVPNNIRWGIALWRGKDNQLINNYAANGRWGIVLVDSDNTFLSCGEYHTNSVVDFYAYDSDALVVGDEYISTNLNLGQRGESDITYIDYDCSLGPCNWTGSECVEEPMPFMIANWVDGTTILGELDIQPDGSLGAWDNSLGSSYLSVVSDNEGGHALRAIGELGVHKSQRVVQKNFPEGLEMWGGSLEINLKNLIHPDYPKDTVIISAYTDNSWDRDFTIKPMGHHYSLDHSYVCIQAYEHSNFVGCSGEIFRIQNNGGNYKDEFIKIEWLFTPDHRFFARVNEEYWQNIFPLPNLYIPDSPNIFSRFNIGWVSSYSGGSIDIRNVKLYNESNLPCSSECMEIVNAEQTCEDSDNGADYYNFGSTVDALSTREDYCDESNSSFLWESRCYCDVEAIISGSNNNRWEEVCPELDRSNYIVKECLFGCESGACLKGNCDDSDGGIDIYNKGSSQLVEEHLEYCQNSSNLLEYSCSENFINQGETFFIRGENEDLLRKYYGATNCYDPGIAYINDVARYIRGDGSFTDYGPGMVPLPYNFKIFNCNIENSSIIFLDDLFIKQESVFCDNGCFDGACNS